MTTPTKTVSQEQSEEIRFQYVKVPFSTSSDIHNCVDNLFPGDRFSTQLWEYADQVEPETLLKNSASPTKLR
ncbi:hypothetical protein PIROE2DRAFT_11573 [Piromyces sp. E2]|nr:hypothetical protein PIROE2DRAFT_11573 [Piromyces sp. E2]|eukprot:OUM62207.1 hypothetical protein PIROE2DRAFT_11573 [Piromyces sp. E2]